MHLYVYMFIYLYLYAPISIYVYLYVCMYVKCRCCGASAVRRPVRLSCACVLCWCAGLVLLCVGRRCAALPVVGVACGRGRRLLWARLLYFHTALRVLPLCVVTTSLRSLLSSHCTRKSFVLHQLSCRLFHNI